MGAARYKLEMEVRYYNNNKDRTVKTPQMIANKLTKRRKG